MRLKTIGSYKIIMTIPAGFNPLFRTSPFTDLIGPLYSRGRGPDLEIGMQVEEKHCNARGTVHGGILATLADIALGHTMAFSTDPPTGLVTSNLTLDFAGTAKMGDWIQTSVDIQKQGKRLSFANCYICADDQRIVRASAVFLVTGSLV